MPEAELTFTARGLAKMSGISRDQLIRWDRAGLIRAAHRHCGNRQERAYTREQALGVLALGELRRRGVSQRRIRIAAGVLPPISIHEHAFLVFDGQLLHTRRTDAEVVDLLSGTNGHCRVLRLGRLVERLARP